MTWTPDREGLLKILWAQGLSANQIAKRLGGVSRNAVISKIHRMGLPKRSESVGGTDKDRASRVKAIASVSAPALPIDRSRETGAVAGDWNVRFLDRTETSCLMFVGGESRDTGLICGERRVEGKPYCKFCVRIAYLPPEMKRRVG